MDYTLACFHTVEQLGQNEVMLPPKFISRLLFIFCLLVASPIARATDLLAIYRLAQCNDPILQAAKEAELAMGEAKPQALANFLPNVSATASQLENHSSIGVVANLPSGSFSYGRTMLNLSITQPVFYYQEWIKYGQATEKVRQARATYAAAELDLIVRTFNGYFAVLKAMDTVYFAKAQTKAFAKFLDQTEQRYKAGLINNTDMEIAKARHDNARAEEIVADNNLMSQKEKLREIIGEPVFGLASLRTGAPLPSPEPSTVEAWLAIALEQNFLLQASRFNVCAARADIKINQANHLPTLNAVGAIDKDTGTPDDPHIVTSFFGLKAALPIFNGGAINSRTRQAMHVYQQAHKQLETLQRQTESMTRQSFNGVLTQLNQIAALTLAVTSNEKALKATESSFNVGSRTIVDVLNAQTDLLRAQKELKSARYDYILQSILLKQAAGTLSPEDVQHVNAWLQ